jgi:glucose/arabinose dehydrogenase
MTRHSRSLFVGLAALCALIPAASTLAHPPHAPYDTTRFAPITRFGPSIGLQTLATGLTAPLKGVTAPGQPDLLYVVDQPGIVWAINVKTGVKSVFLDVRSRIVTLGVCGPNTFDERGLLGLAFHPKYTSNGLLYTYSSEPDVGAPTFPSTVPAGTRPDHHNVIAEWRVGNPLNSASVVDPGSRRELMRVAWPQFNHDGGDLAFGPDNKLYITMGDGGGADDADGQPFVTAPPNFPVCGETPIVGHQGNGNAQRLNTPLGKILRIDVDTRNSANGQYGVPSDNPFVKNGSAIKEIWAYGFRNPFRFSFDKQNGDLYVGDVGQNDIEEVSVVAKGGNHGWNVKEGTLFFHINGSVPDDGFASLSPDPTRVIPKNLVDPVAQYDTHHEGHSVIGGFVYHGSGVPALSKKYVFGDFSVLFKFPTGPHDYGRLFAMDTGGGNLKDISQLLVLPGGALSLALLGLGQDSAGELYALGNISGLPFPNPDPEIGPTGKVIKLVPAEEVEVAD